MLDNTTPATIAARPTSAYVGGYRALLAAIACPHCGRIAQAHDFDTRFHDVELICQGDGCGKILMCAEWVGE
jgi:hypothetical protein